jgi:hypothetical protein
MIGYMQFLDSQVLPAESISAADGALVDWVECRTSFITLNWRREHGGSGATPGHGWTHSGDKWTREGIRSVGYGAAGAE